MKLAELKELAKQMGLRGTSTMRKGELVSTIEAARNGGEAPAGVTVRVPKTAAKSAKSKISKVSADETQSQTLPAAQTAQTEQSAQSEPAAQTADAGNSAAAAESLPVATPAEAAPAETEPVEAKSLPIDLPLPIAAASDGEGDEQPVRRSIRKRDAEPLSLDEIALPAPKETPARKTRNRRAAHADENANHGGAGTLDLNLDLPRIRRRKDTAPEPETNEHVRDLGDILAALPDRSDRPNDRKSTKRRNDDRHLDRSNRDRADRDTRSDRYEQDDDRDFARRNHNDRNDRRGNDRNDRNDRRDRRDRDLRGGRADRDSRMREDVPQEDLVPVAGIVDVLDSYAFVRTSGYLPGPNDVYVSMGQVKKYGLRKGDAVQGTTRPPREGGRNQRQKFVPLQSIETINGMSIEEAQSRPHFNKLTPLYPQERLRMETQPTKLTGRLIDIVSPIGKGQRGLIVSPPKAGKTITLQQIANSITANNPEVHLMVVLVDERPEEVTDMERTVQGEVISSTFDRPASDHTIVAELAIERAKRLVELGQDVVVLLDSMTRLARAYNIAQPASGRILSGGVDAQALYPPKKFFGAARNIENGGSLTIISSALVETGSKMDEVIFEEFKGTGNMELRLSRELADKRLFPAIDINASGTRREELITPPAELAVVYRLRRLMGGMEPEQAYQTLVPRLKKTATNREFLAAITSTMPQNK
ncbi:transcription termination factor Rho [Bifidobacterium margollesii]|uniref:Transcription termination factor Rho n=2 Tax=Bifidobacterium margollesii TaxID=2020964 RepID=A0A2N5JAY7_9BIFI|nr:transcription termination factor Rho [Bifidobacterium margollesii]